MGPDPHSMQPPGTCMGASMNVSRRNERRASAGVTGRTPAASFLCRGSRRAYLTRATYRRLSDIAVDSCCVTGSEAPSHGCHAWKTCPRLRTDGPSPPVTRHEPCRSCCVPSNTSLPSRLSARSAGVARGPRRIAREDPSPFMTHPLECPPVSPLRIEVR